MIFSEIAGIIADDLTGANDTALQFQKQGANTKILLDSSCTPKIKAGTDVWALSSESRNVDSEEAVLRLEKAVKTFTENFSFDYYYKKIDSTLRGNIAVETLKMVELLEYDAAIIIPAYPQEGRITVGGYHLAKGIPLERTEIAIDPHSPIKESHVPTLLRSQLGIKSTAMGGMSASGENKGADIVGTIDLRTVLNGAGPVLMRINELIRQGKKLIVADATSITDIEQIALAINKCEKKILPAGTAAAAQVISKYWLAGIEKTEETGVSAGALPKLIISGTATRITANQISKLEQSDDYDNVNFIPLGIKTILGGVTDELTDRIFTNLKSGVTVCVHTSTIISDFDGFSEDSFNAELTKDKLASMITDYLAELTCRVIAKIELILITLGGETSYKCCKAIGSNELKLVDEVAASISICFDINRKWIITKSGNLGNSNTLIEILNYLAQHE